MRISIAYILLFFVLTAFDNAPSAAPPPSDVEAITHQGNIFSIKVVKSEPIHIYVLGQESAQIDLSKVEVILISESANPTEVADPIQPVHLTTLGNHFIIKNTLSGDRVYTMKVKSKNNGVVETFKFKVKNPIP